MLVHDDLLKHDKSDDNEYWPSSAGSDSDAGSTMGVVGTNIGGGAGLAVVKRLSGRPIALPVLAPCRP